ncbi:MAG: hypothetical protein SGILL_002144 [Bacillariaceae sp.]
MSTQNDYKTFDGAKDATATKPKGAPGPMLGTSWWVVTIVVFAVTAWQNEYNVYKLMFGLRSLVAFLGYLVMQIGLWNAEFKWDEEGSAAYLEVAGKDKSLTPEELDSMEIEDVEIPQDKKKAAFPTPWGFLVGWWLWGLSYMFPVDGSFKVA